MKQRSLLLTDFLNVMKLSNLLKKALPEQAKQRLKKIMGFPQTRLHLNWKILEIIGPVYENHIVIDIGSYHGWFFHCWKDWCPQAEIHAFEPSSEAYERSIELYGSDTLITINPLGIGDKPDEKDFYVMEESRVSNSFLPHNRETWDEIQYTTGLISKRRISVTSVDYYCKEQNISSIYLMKIDAQGYEMKVLKGAEDTLPIVSHVFVESAIRPLYKGAPKFTEIIDHLIGHNFHLMAMQAWHRGNNVLVETDMLFRRNDLMPNINTGIDRIVEKVG